MIDSLNSRVKELNDCFNMYSLYDRVSGLYSEPFVAQNDEIAKRRFNYFCEHSPMIASDCELYCVGVWHNSQGFVYGNDKPVFIVKYEVNYGNE